MQGLTLSVPRGGGYMIQIFTEFFFWNYRSHEGCSLVLVVSLWNVILLNSEYYLAIWCFLGVCLIDSIKNYY